MRLKWSALLLGIMLMGSVLTGCGQPESDHTTESTTRQDVDSSDHTSSVEKHILTFEAKTIDGEVVTSDCFADSQLTMINIWATYCNPCLMEMPDLGEIAASYDKSEFQLIGVISDVMDEMTEEDKANARALIQETGADYPHLLLNESLYVNLVGGVTAVPTTFFVTREGEVLGYVSGARSKEEWEALIHELLEENP